jgi:hypothetical protein
MRNRTAVVTHNASIGVVDRVVHEVAVHIAADIDSCAVVERIIRIESAGGKDVVDDVSHEVGILADAEVVAAGGNAEVVVVGMIVEEPDAFRVVLEAHARAGRRIRGAMVMNGVLGEDNV